MKIIPKTRLDVHFGEIRSDLAQLDTVMDDAVAMLFAAFTNIAGLVRLEQKLAAQFSLIHEERRLDRGTECSELALAARVDTPLSLLLAQHAVLAEQIETQINAVIRSLQFQDLCSQILSHTGNRLAALELVLAGVEPRAAADHEAEDARSMREAAAVRATADVIAFPRSRPVVQHGMHSGDVELF